MSNFAEMTSRAPRTARAAALCLLLLVGTGCPRDSGGGGGDSALSGSGSREAKSTAGLPNIVFAVYDNTRFDRYSINGNTRNTSPFFDRLASEGIYLANAVAPATWTFPSHASMFTGYTNHQLKVDNANANSLVIPQGVRTITQLLADRGYFTVSFPDHPYFGPVNASLTRGFRFFNILFNPLQTPSLAFANTPDGLLRDRRIAVSAPSDADNLALLRETRERLGTGPAEYVKPDPDREIFPSVKPYLGRYLAQRYAELTETLAQRGSRPFFLFLNLHNGPLHLTTINENSRWLVEYLAENQLGPLAVDRDGFNSLDNTFLKSDYVLAFGDATLEALYRMFQSTPGMENTVFIIASDHGQAHGEHGERKFYKHAMALPWEYMLRVPAAIRFPDSLADRFPRGRVDQQVSLTDLFFTIAEIGDCAGQAYVQNVAELNGMSLLARMRENRYQDYVAGESYMVIPYSEIAALLPGPATTRRLGPKEKLAGNVYAIYKGRHKLVHAPQCRIVGRDPAEFLEVTLLFDVQNDPGETTNLADSEPDLLREMMGYFRRHKDAERSVNLDALPRLEYDTATLRQLRALGYVGGDDEEPRSGTGG